jgi:hypothetical protein
MSYMSELHIELQQLGLSLEQISELSVQEALALVGR